MNQKFITKTKNIFQIQNRMYEDKIILTDTVPANSMKMGKAAVSNLGHFQCYQIAGHYESQKLITKTDLSTVLIDEGMCHLRGQLEDATGNRKLMSDYIPLNLLLSCGRVKYITHVPANAFNVVLDSDNVTVIAGPAEPSNNLFFPMPFKYTFSANSDILFNVKNDSNTPLSYEIVFYGFRRLDSTYVQGV